MEKRDNLSEAEREERDVSRPVRERSSFSDSFQSPLVWFICVTLCSDLPHVWRREEGGAETRGRGPARTANFEVLLRLQSHFEITNLTVKVFHSSPSSHPISSCSSSYSLSSSSSLPPFFSFSTPLASLPPLPPPLPTSPFFHCPPHICVLLPPQPPTLYSLLPVKVLHLSHVPCLPLLLLSSSWRHLHLLL